MEAAENMHLLGKPYSLRTVGNKGGGSANAHLASSAGHLWGNSSCWPWQLTAIMTWGGDRFSQALTPQIISHSSTPNEYRSAA